jgi:hypothetical protein
VVPHQQNPKQTERTGNPAFSIRTIREIRGGESPGESPPVPHSPAIFEFFAPGGNTLSLQPKPQFSSPETFSLTELGVVDEKWKKSHTRIKYQRAEASRGRVRSNW